MYTPKTSRHLDIHFERPEFSNNSPHDMDTRTPSLMKDLTSIIILNYNGVNHIKRCIESIRRHTDEPYELIVFDNASTDGSREYLRGLNNITLVESPTNIGCPPARAKAMALAKGNYILFLDNDTIVTPLWLHRMLRHLERDQTIGMLGPRSNYVSGAQKIATSKYSSIFEMEEFSKLVAFEAEKTGLLSYTNRLVGFCVLIRKEVVDKIGVPDSRLGKFGFEDDDYTLRCLLAGYKAAIANDVFIHHSGGPQGKGDPFYNQSMQNAWKIFKKKWKLPPELPLAKYSPTLLLNRSFDPRKHYIPPPDINDINPYISRRPNKTPSRGRRHREPSPKATRWAATCSERLLAPAFAAYYLGQTERAFVILKNAVEKHGDSYEANCALGAYLAQKGLFEQAISHLKKAADAQPYSCKPPNLLGLILGRLGQWNKAEMMFRRALEVSLYSFEAITNLARLYLITGRTKEAFNTTIKIFQQVPDDKDILIMMAHLAIRAEDYDMALDYLRKCLELHSEDIELFVLNLICYRLKGCKDEELQMIRKIESYTKLAPNIKTAVSSLLQELLCSNRAMLLRNQKILSYIEVLRVECNKKKIFSVDFLVNPPLMAELYHYAKNLYESGLEADSITLYNRLLHICPNSANLINDLGAIHWNQGKTQEALNYFLRAIELDPNNKDVVWNCGQVLLECGYLEDAIALYEAFLNKHPENDDMQKILSRLKSSSKTAQKPVNARYSK